MPRRLAVAAVVLLLALSTRAATETPIPQLYLEVSALSMLYDLTATPDQLKSLQSLSADTAAKKPAGDPHPGRPYRSALTALRDAYLNNDDTEISDCQDRLSALEEKMDNPPDTTVDITDAARKKAADAVKLFTPAQLAEYIASRSEDAPDPTATLIDAIDSVRAEKNYDRARDQVAEEIATDLAGLSGKDHQSVRDAVAAFLDKTHAISDDELKTQHADLETQARKLTPTPDPLAVLSHWIQRDLAELLSNPMLPKALAGRSK